MCKNFIEKKPQEKNYMNILNSRMKLRKDNREIVSDVHGEGVRGDGGVKQIYIYMYIYRERDRERQ